MDTKHTMGPWKTGDQNGHCGISITDDHGSRIATAYLGLVTSRVPRGEETFALPENTESVANANLIAAAPDLLKALRDIVEYPSFPLEEMWNAARSAIAKATGSAA